MPLVHFQYHKKKKDSKREDLSPNVLIITLKVNGIRITIKRQKLEKWIFF
jgi:hypothetical protein